MVNGVLYTTAGTRRAVIALDAATGELIWVHRYPKVRAVPPRRGSCRAAASRIGPTAAATSASSTSRPVIADRARRKDRTAGPVVRQRRRRRSESRRRLRRRQADRSRDGRDRSPLDAHGRARTSSRRLRDEGRHDGHDPQQHQGARRAPSTCGPGKLLWTFNTIPRPGEPATTRG